MADILSQFIYRIVDLFLDKTFWPFFNENVLPKADIFSYQNITNGTNSLKRDNHKNKIVTELLSFFSLHNAWEVDSWCMSNVKLATAEMKMLTKPTKHRKIENKLRKPISRTKITLWRSEWAEIINFFHPRNELKFEAGKIRKWEIETYLNLCDTQHVSVFISEHNLHQFRYLTSSFFNWIKF